MSKNGKSARSHRIAGQGLGQGCGKSAEREASRSQLIDAAMSRYAGGDDGAFEVIYAALAPAVYAFLRRYTRQGALSEDLTQQTLLQIHRHRDRYVSGSPLLPWAFAIARRLFIDEFRRKRIDVLHGARSVCDDDWVGVIDQDDELDVRQTARQIEIQLARLPDSQRAAFALIRIEGLSHEQAAALLGTTVSAVKLRAFRAYAALRAVVALDRLED